MIVIVDSLTGQAKKLALKIGFPVIDIKEDIKDDDLNAYFLITRSHQFGQITDLTKSFLDQHAKKVVGVAVSGNRNWGSNFGAAGYKIEQIYQIPLVHRFEGSGFEEDVKIIREWLNNNI